MSIDAICLRLHFLLLLVFLACLGDFAIGVRASPNLLPRQGNATSTTADCLYVADALSATKGVIYAYDMNGTVVFSLNVSTTPSAMTIDHTRQRLYVAIATNLLALDISHELDAVLTACACSTAYFTLTSTVTGIAVDETSGTVYFAYSSSLCYVTLQSSYPQCMSYTLSAFDSFGALTISQDRRELYVVGASQRRVYRFSLAAVGFPTQITTFEPAMGWKPLWGITMRQGDILAGANPVDFSLSFAGMLLLNPATGDSLASLTDLYTEEYSNLASDSENDTRFIYHIIKSGSFFPNYTVRRFELLQSSNILTRANTTTFIPGGVLREPQALVVGRCPYIAPSPSPSATPSVTPDPVISGNAGADLIALTIVLPTVVGSILACCACCVVAAALVIGVARRRRRWFESEAERVAGEGDLEMLAATKFTYREIDSRELTLGRMLGQGAFGKVYKGEYRGAVVAVKMFEGVRLEQADNRLLRELRSEAQMMEVLSNHPNIVKFVGAVTQAASLDDSFALVLEYCPRGSLYDLLVKKKKKLPLITLVRMARDAAYGILHLHKEKVIHRDIAARNMLVGQNYEVYVSDFGLARVKESEEEAGTTKQTFGPVGWMAPEALQSRQYSEGTDAFSFGVMLWEMMARKRPWAGIEVAQIVTAVVSNTRLKIPSDSDPVFSRLMKQCWRQNPAHRPSFDKIVITLSDYYQTLKKIQDVDTECPELSEESEEDVTDEGRSDVSFTSWEQKRLKDEIKSFLKQVILERGEDDFSQVERAYVSALQDLRRHYSPDAVEDIFPVINADTHTFDQQTPNLASALSNAYASIISRTDDDGETTGAESAGGSSVVSRSARVTKSPTSPSPRQDADAWLSPYAFPVLDAAGGVGKRGFQQKDRNKDKKNVKWNDDDDDADAGAREEEEREEEDVNSNRNLKAMHQLRQGRAKPATGRKSSGSPPSKTAKPPAALPAFVSYATLMLPQPMTPDGREGGESASAPSSDQASHITGSPTSSRRPPPKRPPRASALTSGTTAMATAPVSDVEDESGETYVTISDGDALCTPTAAAVASARQSSDAAATVPERLRAPQRPPRQRPAGDAATSDYCEVALE